MSEVIYRDLVGPFDSTAFLMFWEYPGCEFFYYLDKGPQYYVERVFADNVTVFKLRAGFKGDVAVTANNGRLEFSFREFVPGLGCSCCGDKDEGAEATPKKTDLPKPGENAPQPDEEALKQAREGILQSLESMNGGDPIDPPGPGVCVSPSCGTFSPCPPLQPILTCDPNGGNPQCNPF